MYVKCVNNCMAFIVRRIVQQFVKRWQSVGIGIVWGILTKLLKMRENDGFCCRLFRPLAKEFQREKCSLKHEPVADFFKSQWQRSSKSIWWMIYRWCFAASFAAGVTGSLVIQFYDGKWFIFLTDWGFFLCMYTSIFGAVLVSIYHCNPDKFTPGALVLKIYWASHWSTLVLATLITFIYWLFIFPTDSSSSTAIFNLWAHAFNTLLMLLDHMLVAFPTRILHFIYPLTVGILYCVFTIIYYFAGGLDTYGNNYIYKILDWSYPSWALATVFGALTVIFIFCFLLFFLYKLRTWIYRKCNNTELSLTA